MRKAKTLQVGDRLIILNGIDPLMYVDLTNKKLHVYREKKPFNFIYKVKSRITK